jgi:hypothetical protein
MVFIVQNGDSRTRERLINLEQCVDAEIDQIERQFKVLKRRLVREPATPTVENVQ